MHSPIVETLLQIVHVITSLFLVLVVLLQQGKGGGLGAAFGGGATAQVFGGRGAGNVLTRATAISASIFMLTSVSLAYSSASGDRELKERAKVEEAKRSKLSPKKDEPKAAEPKGAVGPTPAPESTPAESKTPPAEGDKTPAAPATDTPPAAPAK
ncbi:MAG: preprotein translocase subunit SecG [Myxococcales bacterium]|nr:preprotein translocase subunit SecG [Myxococcales bacterium]